MKVVIAPDSFKECMSAKEAGFAIAEGFHSVDPSIECYLIPIADGGEGTLDCLIDVHQGQKELIEVYDPLLRKIQAPIGIMQHFAVIESAKCCGLELLKEEEKNPFLTSTYGLGQMIKLAMDKGIKQFLITLGGSSTNDGGIGMLQALGAHFYDKDMLEVSPNGEGLTKIESIDLNGIDPRIKDVKIVCGCDVNNPLCSTNGATYVYGKQKGLLEKDMERLDQAMYHYGKLVEKSLSKSLMEDAGAGAAGGLGFAFKILGASLQKGFNIVAKLNGLEQYIQSCDLVIVGEGRMDKQTGYGKTPYGVMQIAKKYNKPVYGFAGSLSDIDDLRKLGFDGVQCITPKNTILEVALLEGYENLRKKATEFMTFYLMTL